MSEQFAIIPARVLKDTRLTNAQLRLLCVLATYADVCGRCYPSQATLAVECNCCERAIRSQLSELVKYGYVKVVRYIFSGKTRNYYYILYNSKRNLDSSWNRNLDSSWDRNLDSSKTESIRTESILTKKETNKEKDLREFDEKYVTAEDRALFTDFLAKLKPELPAEVACWLSCIDFWKKEGSYFVSFNTRTANEKFMGFRGFIGSLLPIPVQYLGYVAGGLEHRGYKKIIVLQDVKQG